MPAGNSSKQILRSRKIVPTLWVWGRGYNFQLGLGGRQIGQESFPYPIEIDQKQNWKSIVKGGCIAYSTFGIRNNGTLWAWGANNVGQLGLRDVSVRSSPVQVGTGTDWSTVTSSYHTHAIKTTGTLWSWGNAANGRLGINSSTPNRSSPVQVGTDTDWADISTGNAHSHGIKTNGTLWSWGNHLNGRLGVGLVSNQPTPLQIGLLTNWKYVSAGAFAGLAVKTDGTLWSWGVGTYGQRGSSNTTTVSSPVQVGTDTNWKNVYLGAGGHAIGVKTNGTLWAWGNNNYGQLGLNDTTNRSSPVQVGTDTNWSYAAANSSITLAVKTDGTLWSWGGGTIASVVQGQLGNGGPTDTVKVPSQTIDGYSGWENRSRCMSAQSLRIRTNGTLWAWGNNTNGELGLGNAGVATTRSSPVQVGTNTNWSYVTVGNGFTIAVKSNGTLWSWGTGTAGRLANGSTASRSSPVQVGTDTNWKRSVGSIGANRFHTLAIKDTGSLWAWGTGVHGQLGTNSAPTGVSVPTQIGANTDWDMVASGSRYFSLAIKTNGTLWAWGQNNNGELGLGNTVTRSSPVQVGTDTNWKWVECGNSFTLALKTDGTLWSWGSFSFGQLGRSTGAGSSPVQIGTGTNWQSISCGYAHALAIKTDGTLWSWGFNDTGQLGLGRGTIRINVSSPVQVGSNTDWNFSDSISISSFAVKTNGTLWAWGTQSASTNACIQPNVVTSRSSPVQIGSATNWKSIRLGRGHAIALKKFTTENPQV